MPGVDLGIVIGTVIVFALLLAVVAGFGAARVLMHAAQSDPSDGGGSHDR